MLQSLQDLDARLCSMQLHHTAYGFNQPISKKVIYSRVNSFTSVDEQFGFIRPAIYIHTVFKITVTSKLL